MYGGNVVAMRFIRSMKLLYAGPG